MFSGPHQAPPRQLGYCPQLWGLFPPLKVPPGLVTPRTVLKGHFEQRKSNISFCPDIKKWAFIWLETDRSTNPSDPGFLI